MENKEKMDYEALKGVILSDDNVAQRRCFGTMFGTDKTVPTVARIGKQMLHNCKVWITNWETVQEAIAPELTEIRKKQLEDELSRLSIADKTYILEALQSNPL